MVQTWKTSPSERTACDRCGSIYAKTVTRLPVRDSDYFDCRVCGERMDSWNGTHVPAYALVEAKPWPKPKE